MRELKYRTGVTNKGLVIAWNETTGYVAQVTTEASRRVRAEVVVDDHIVSTISMNLERLIADAVDKGDRHAIIKACQVWAQVTGAGAATKVQVQNDLTAMSPEQLQARKAEIIARLTGKPIPVPVPFEVKTLELETEGDPADA
jgi:hypothetical protein